MRIAFSIIACALLVCCAIQSPQAGPVGFRLSSSFSPLSVSGMAAWWAARLETSYTNNASIGSVYDWTGNGLSLTQSTSSKKPLFLTGQKNGLPAFSADGVDDFLTGGDILDIGTGSIHFFFVAKFDATANPQPLAAKALAASEFGRYFAGGIISSEWYSLAQDGTAVREAKGSVPNTNWHLFEFVVDRPNTRVELFVDGASVGSNSSLAAGDLNTATRWLLFAQSNATDTGEVVWMQGKIAEVWCWKRVLSSSEIAALRSFANRIYAIY